MLRDAPYVVVRRGPALAGGVPVGVRGPVRSLRWASHLDAPGIGALISPEDLVRDGVRARPGRAALIPALQALAPVAAWLAEWGCVWGPTGAVGFELASGWPATTVASDLDVLIRRPLRLERAEARAILRGVQRAPVRVDLQLDTPAGLVALAEYAGSGPKVLARAGEGVELVDDPWRPAPGHGARQGP